MKRFDTLQALRGVAAVSVMLMHCATNQQGLSLRIDHPAFYWVTRALAAGGGAGVDIFFVISGFVITSVVLRTPATQRRLAASADFLLRRILRVFPLYWVTLAGMVGLAAAFGAPVSELSQAWHLRVILLLVDKIPYQPPAWTLAFEMWFYAGTAVLIGLLPKRRFFAGLSVWGGAQAAILFSPWLARHVPNFYGFHQPELLDFFMGCGIAALLQLFPGRHGPMPLMALAASAIGFMIGTARCFGMLPTGSLDDWQRMEFYGVPAALLLYGLLLLERRRQARAPRWLCRLGDWSYSIYLWHYPVMSFTFVMVSFHPDLHVRSPMAAAALNAAITLAIAPLSFWCIEKPFNTLGVRRPKALPRAAWK
jgi:peptidoglycan/LPS O-acetylase OafA/YrhL